MQTCQYLLKDAGVQVKFRRIPMHCLLLILMLVKELKYLIPMSKVKKKTTTKKIVYGHFIINFFTMEDCLKSRWPGHNPIDSDSDYCQMCT